MGFNEQIKRKEKKETKSNKMDSRNLPQKQLFS